MESGIKSAIALMGIVLILCSMTVPATAQLADTSWPMFHHDLNHTGLSPYYGPDTAALKWTFSTGDKIYGSAAIAEDGTIYIGTRDYCYLTRSRLYAINPDGTKRWHWSPPHYPCWCSVDYIDSTPAVASDGTIYVGCWNRRLYALYPNGTQKWVFYDTSQCKKCQGFVLTSPAIVTDGTIYIGNNNGKLYAINPDGSLKWSYQTGRPIQSSPAVGPDGTVYVGSYDRKLYAINPDGTLKWKYYTGAIKSSPAIGSDGTIYVGSYNKKLYAIKPDGNLKWTYPTGCYITSSPAIGADGTIYVGSFDKKLYAIYPNGTLNWSYTTSGYITSSPAIDAYGTIHVGSRDRYVYAINPNGTLLWKYNTGHRIYYSAPAIASDGTMYIGTHSGKLYAFGPGTPPKRPPVLNLIGYQTVDEGAELDITITASDPDGDSLTFSSNASFGTFTTINSTATYWSWTPGYNDAGTYYVDFDVSDGEFNDNETVQITVNDTNRPPVLNSIGYQTVDEGVKLNITITASDPDGDSLTFSSNASFGTLTTINSTATYWSWTPGYNDAGTYYVDFGVSDGEFSDNETVEIKVNNTNRPPVLDPIGYQTVDEGTELNITITASDQDGDSLTFSSNASFGTFTTINSTATYWRWTPDYNDAGTYYVDFGVSDGEFSDNETVEIKVNNTNRAPVLEQIGDKSVNVTELLEFTVNASDPDGDTLTYAASNLSAGATFDGITRKFSWTPNFNQKGTYSDVYFEVSDGKLTDWENITIMVGGNRPPVLDPIGNKWVNESDLLDFTVNATDADGDALTYAASNLPDGATFDSITRKFSWTPDFDQADSYPDVHFEVSDGELTDWENITITVNNTNRAPVLNYIGSKSTDEGVELSITITVSDPDGDSLTFSSNASFGTFTIINSTATYWRWTPDYNDAGTYYVDFGVSDGEFCDNETVQITVDNTNRAPVLNSIGSQTTDEGTELSITITASDPDGDSLTFGSNASFGTFTKINSTATYWCWTPSYNDAGTYYVDFGVSDGEFSGNETVQITVNNTNRPPVLETVGNKLVNESELLEFTVNATDPDGDSLTFLASNLPSGATFNVTTQTFSWIPSTGQAGIYPGVHFEVSDGGLIDFENITVTVKGPIVEISIDPENTYIQPQDQFDVNITVDSQWNPVYAVQYCLRYNTSVVRAETQTKRSFLGNPGETIVVINSIDRTNGIICYAESRKGDVGVTGKGTIATIQFTVIGNPGAAGNLNFSDVIIVNSATDEPYNQVNIINGSVTLSNNTPPIAEGVSKHRINNVAKKYQSTAVLCSCSCDPDYPGKGGNISYIRWAFGDGQYGTSEGLPVDNCTCKEHKYESWQWENGDYAPFNATLTVTDDGCPELSNSISFDVNVYIAGDANGDGEVNVLDVVWVGKYWRSECPSTNQCANCIAYLWTDAEVDGADMNNDCEINVLDVVIIGANWRYTAW